MAHPKLEKKIVDFGDSDSLLVALSNSDVVFCSIGTTQKKVKGDKEAYKKIDFDIPARLAKLCKMTGCEKFVLVSSVGADKTSGNFYLQLKGEVEEAVRATGLNSVHIMRPSMLLGKRKEYRAAEKIIGPLMKIFSFLVPAKYKAIEAVEVAKAMAAAGMKVEPGVSVYEYEEIRKLANTNQAD
jgi:uncharacterized protein YbjT (DUF2867 family)